MSEAIFNTLKDGINERQEELDAVQTVLNSKANQYYDLSKWLRIIVIFLGALVVTREVAEKLYPASSNSFGSKFFLVLYTIVGVAIAVIGGISAAFRYDNRADGLRSLAVKCRSYTLDIDSKLPTEGDNSPLEEQIAAARNLVIQQNTCLDELQGKAAELGVDIVRKVRKITTYKTSSGN